MSATEKIRKNSITTTNAAPSRLPIQFLDMCFPVSAPIMLTGNTKVMNFIAKGKKYTLNENTNKEAPIATKDPMPIACQFVNSFSLIAFPSEFISEMLCYVIPT